MSVVPAISGTVAASAAAAAAKRRREEEQMATYNRDDLGGWEFKIMRSALGRFSNQRAIQKVCAEEAQSGWELIEKFDECRLRFKRRVERRSNDHMATLDPYRTSIGFQGGTFAGIFVGVILLLAGIAAFIFLGHRGGVLPFDLQSSPILLIAGLILLIGLVVLVLKKRR